MPEYSKQDVEYQIYWGTGPEGADKYPYVHKTKEGAEETIQDIYGDLKQDYGIHLDPELITIKSRVTITNTSEWVDETG